MQKEKEKKLKSILDKQQKETDHKAENKSILNEEVVKRREWSHLKKSDQQENLYLNQRQNELIKQKLIEKHMMLQNQLVDMKQSQEMVKEQRRKQDLERRRVVEEITD